ncbi:hypothetical protein ABFS83_02G024800 [Erythranthe nasuta]
MRALKEGLKFQSHALKSGFLPTIVTTNQLIDLYSKHGFIEDAQKLFDEMPDRNVFSWNTILNTYIKSRNFSRARIIFDSSPCKDSVTYNSMIAGYARCDGYEREAIELFNQMQFDNNGIARIDEFTLTTMLNLIAKLRVLRYGMQVHCFMVKSGSDLSAFALSSLIDMYSKCGSFSDASRVVKECDGEGFVDLVVKNALIAACCREGQMETAEQIFFTNPEFNDNVTWNTMISGYIQKGCEKKAIELFKRMGQEGFQRNEHTLASLLTACSSLKDLKLGKEVHAWVLKQRMCSNSFISSGIIDIYCKCGSMSYAEGVFKTFGIGNIFAVTSMIVGYSAKGDMKQARRLFDSLGEKNFVIWTAIISGYVRLQNCEDAFILFCEYAENETVVLDAVILVSLLCACAIKANVDFGKQIHAYILRTGIPMDEKAISAIIDMYSKCGSIVYSRRIFRTVSVKDTVIYNVMIAGFAHHGYEQEAIFLFEDMIAKGLKPDAVTFIALLSACRHSGLITVGEQYFSSMSENYRITPETDHYACMVDLYGRSNQLEKAVSFMEKMPFEPDSIIISTFLNACRANRNMELARTAERKLMEIEGYNGNNGSRYFQLASVYASGGEWGEMGRVMRIMRGKEVKKVAGCSWVQIGNGVHIFTSGGRSHAEAEAIYSILGCLINELYGEDISDMLD